MKKFLLALLLFVATDIFAISYSYSEYVDVVRSEPVFRTVVKRIPYEECWYEEVPVEYSNPINDNIGAIIGGVAGGIIGHQIGKGGGKSAATVGGAIIGTLVGKNLSSRRDVYADRGYKRVKRCRTRYEEYEERVQKGYKNYTYYNGREIVKFSKTPLRKIRINITISY